MRISRASHNVWVKVVADTICAIFLSAQPAWARYRPRYSTTDYLVSAVVTTVSTAIRVGSAGQRNLTFASAVLKPSAVYGVTLIGQRNGWDPHVTAVAAATAGGFVSGGIKGAIVEAGTAATYETIQHYTEEAGWGVWGDAAALLVSVVVSDALSALVSINFEIKSRETTNQETGKKETVEVLHNKRTGEDIAYNAEKGKWYNVDTGEKAKRVPYGAIGDGSAFAAGTGFGDRFVQKLEDRWNSGFFLNLALKTGFESIGEAVGTRDARLLASFGVAAVDGFQIAKEAKTGSKGADIALGVAAALVEGATSYGLSAATHNSSDALLIDAAAVIGTSVIKGAAQAIRERNDLAAYSKMEVPEDGEEPTKAGQFLRKAGGVGNIILGNISNSFVEMSATTAQIVGLEGLGSGNPIATAQICDFLVNVQENGFTNALAQFNQSLMHNQAVSNMGDMVRGEYPVLAKVSPSAGFSDLKVKDGAEPVVVPAPIYDGVEQPPVGAETGKVYTETKDGYVAKTRDGKNIYTSLQGDNIIAKTKSFFTDKFVSSEDMVNKPGTISFGDGKVKHKTNDWNADGKISIMEKVFAGYHDTNGNGMPDLLGGRDHVIVKNGVTFEVVAKDLNNDGKVTVGEKWKQLFTETGPRMSVPATPVSGTYNKNGTNVTVGDGQTTRASGYMQYKDPVTHETKIGKIVGPAPTSNGVAMVSVVETEPIKSEPTFTPVKPVVPPKKDGGTSPFKTTPESSVTAVARSSDAALREPYRDSRGETRDASRDYSSGTGATIDTRTSYDTGMSGSYQVPASYDTGTSYDTSTSYRGF